MTGRISIPGIRVSAVALSATVVALTMIGGSLARQEASAQTATHIAEGDIETSNPASKTVGGRTENDFASDCKYPPASQGFDGWVFQLPTGFALPAPGSVTGESTAPYDLDAYFYTADCTLLRGNGDFNMATLSPDEEGTISATTRYVVVDAAAGADIHVVLCAGDQSGCATANPSPTGSSGSASPTASASASPTASESASPTESPTVSPTASESASPTGSPTASPTPKQDPTTVRHSRTIGLHLGDRSGRLVARGRVRVEDAYESCYQDVPVKLQRRKGGRWVTLAKTETDTEGRYRVVVSDRAGRYRAKALRHSEGMAPKHVCKAATKTRRHRHGS